MVTFAQAQERAEEWINGDVPGYQHREVRVREFELGFVVWAEDRADGPRSDGGAQRLVIARDSGEATLWPGLPVGEVIRRYEEEYGAPDGTPEPAPAAFGPGRPQPDVVPAESPGVAAGGRGQAGDPGPASGGVRRFRLRRGGIASGRGRRGRRGIGPGAGSGFHGRWSGGSGAG